MEESAKLFKTAQGKKVRQIQTAEEEEFMQMLSGCDTSNDSGDNVKNKNILRSLEKNPGTQMARKTNFIAGKQTKPEAKQKELQEIKLIKAASTVQTKAPPISRSKPYSSSSFVVTSQGTTLKDLTTANAKSTSPNKRHQANAPKSLTEQQIADSKESFVRTVLTARQECVEFNTKVRKTEQDFGLNTRNLNSGTCGKGLSQTETSTFNQGQSLQAV